MSRGGSGFVLRGEGRSLQVAVGALSLLALLAQMPNAVWLVTDQLPANYFQDYVLQGVATIGLLLSLFSRIWIGALMLAPWAILAPVESFYIRDFGKPSDTHLIGIISDTNIAEASGFLSGVIAQILLTMVVAAGVALVAIVGAYRKKLRWHGRLRVVVLVASVIALSLPEIAKLHGPAKSLAVPVANAAARAPGAELADDHVVELFDYLLPVYPAGVPARIVAYGGQRRAMNEAINMIADFKFLAAQGGAVAHRKQIYVFVIGETGRPDRLQINGYARETTPRMLKEENLVSFQDAFSPWAWTRMSVPVMLTRKSGLDNNQFFAERSFISAFREAGFRTYWFSTQSPLGPHDSSIALHASEANETKFLNPLDYKTAGVLDEALLRPLDQVLNRNEQKVLIVLHTLGGHFNYADRYSANFDVFKPSLKGVKGASLHKPELKEEFGNSFDNSVLYLDYFLAEIIDRLKASDAIASMFYMADHGENLFDGSCDKAGHGRGNEYDFRVPAIWWYSREYAIAFPDKVANAKTRVRAPISTENVFHSMLDGANIRFPEEEMSLSLFSVEWRPMPRITQNKIDFDKAERDPTCKKLLPTPPSIS